MMVTIPSCPRPPPDPPPPPCMYAPLEVLLPVIPPEPPDPPDVPLLSVSTVTSQFRTFVSSSPICLAGRFEGAGDLRASPSQPRDAPRCEAGCLYAGKKPRPLTPIEIERASIDGPSASSWAWVSKTFESNIIYLASESPISKMEPPLPANLGIADLKLRLSNSSPMPPSTSPWLAASLSPPQHIKGAELSSATYVHDGTCPLMLNLLMFDEERLGLNFMVPWPQHGNVGGWSPCLNSTTAYPSTTVELMYQVIKVSHSLEPVSTHLSTKPRTVTMSLVYMEITSVVHSSECSRTGVHGTVSTASPSVSSNNMFSGKVEIHLVSRFIIVGIRADLVCLMDCIAKSSFSVGLSSVLVFTNNLQTRSSGSSFIDCCTDISMFLGTSVSGFQVKHVYGFLHPFNTPISCCSTFRFRLAVEFTSGCNRLNPLDI
uniref:Uncharacterized protein n=1 Tax=Brassica campestris TaxID=3711 RepID=M4CLC3_BRACM